MTCMHFLGWFFNNRGLFNLEWNFIFCNLQIAILLGGGPKSETAKEEIRIHL